LTFIFLLGIVAFITSVSKYGLLLAKIRSYIKENQNELYKKYHLDVASLMLGPPSVDWDFQMFILKKKYLAIDDQKLVELCNKTYKWGVSTYSSFLTTFFAIIINGVVSS